MMKRHRLQVTVFLFCIVVLLCACGRQDDPAGVHEDGGVHGDATIGPKVQTGGDATGAIEIENSGQLVTQSYDFSGFDAVEASMFDLDIQRGDRHAVFIEVEKNAFDHVRLDLEGGVLKLGLATDQSYNMTNIPLRATITMPALKAITLDLGSETTLAGFNCGDELAKTLTLGSSLNCNLGSDQVRFKASF
jgi:hypothetical protein